MSVYMLSPAYFSYVNHFVLKISCLKKDVSNKGCQVLGEVEFNLNPEVKG